MRRNCWSSERIQSVYLFVRRAVNKTSEYRGISLLSNVCRILSNILLSKLTPYA